MRKCYQLIGNGHSKFWTVEVIGSTYLATFGRIGTAGQTQVKTFSRAREAEGKAHAMIDEKTGKGYQRVGDNAHPGAPADLVKRLKNDAAPPRPIPPPPAPAPETAPVIAPPPTGRRIIVTPPEPQQLATGRRIIILDP